jgi:hypothetical protein
VLSAIVIVGRETREEGGNTPFGEASAKSLPAAMQIQQGTPLVCVEVVVRRVIEQLQRAGVCMISVVGVVTGELASADEGSTLTMDLCSAEENWCKATQQLMCHKQSGADATVVVRVGACVDSDLEDALQFHRERGQVVTRAFEENGRPLDLWIIDLARIAEDADILRTLRAAKPARYPVRGYVNRLEHPRDLRRLVVDALTSRCRFRPQGSEVRPGFWMDDEAQVHRDARIVAPAFIGRGARIADRGTVLDHPVQQYREQLPC